MINIIIITGVFNFTVIRITVMRDDFELRLVDSMAELNEMPDPEIIKSRH